jgi:hypothetical protein
MTGSETLTTPSDQKKAVKGHGLRYMLAWAMLSPPESREIKQV